MKDIILIGLIGLLFMTSCIYNGCLTYKEEVIVECYDVAVFHFNNVSLEDITYYTQHPSARVELIYEEINESYWSTYEECINQTFLICQRYS